MWQNKNLRLRMNVDLAIHQSTAMVAQVHNLDRSGLRVDIIGYQQVKDLEHAYKTRTLTTVFPPEILDPSKLNCELLNRFWS